MNESAPKTKRWRIALLAAAILVAIMAVFVALTWLYLPALISDRLPVDDIRQLGFAGFSGRVNAITPTHTLAGPIVFGAATRPAISIGSLEIDYTPGGLRRKTIRGIQASEVVINADISPEGVVLPGLDPSRLNPASGQPDDGTAAQAQEAAPLADLHIDHLTIRNGQLNLRWRDTTFHLPFSLDLAPTGSGLRRFDARLQLFVRDQALALTASVDLTRPAAWIKLDGRKLALDAFGDLIDGIPVSGLAASGVASLTADATLTLSPLAVSDIHADLIWQRGRLHAAGIGVVPAGPSTPATVSIAGSSLDSFAVKVGGIRIASPLPVRLDSVAVTLTRDDAGHRISGSASLALPEGSLMPFLPAELKKGARLQLDVVASMASDRTWQARLSTATSMPTRPRMELVADGNAAVLSAGVPRFSLTATGRGATGEIDWRASLDALRGQLGGDTAAFEATSVVGEGRFQFATDADGPTYTGQATVRIPGLTMDGIGLNGTMKDLSLTARIGPSTGGMPAVEGRLHCDSGRLAYPESGFSLAGITLDLPVSLGRAPANGRGSLQIRQIVKGKQVMGAAQATIRQKSAAYVLNGTISSRLLPGLTATVDGTFQTAGDRVGESRLTVALPAWTLPADADWSVFSPAVQDMTLAGHIAGDAAMSLSRGRLAGEMNVSLTEGRLAIPSRKITMDGIQVALHIPDLPHIRSAAAQHLRFRQASMGGLVLDQSSIDFKVEADDTIFVEKGRLAWCGGIVDTGSLRITAGKTDYALNLYCQRLGLSAILEQLGSVNARGTGTVNGRIPISYIAGKLRIDDGFLFSTPGEGGLIQLTGTDMLTQGIPPDTPQFAQVDLAREALKDYTYDWAKLGLSSEGETFVLRLQFNGKPARPLPFVYKKEIGGFMRVEAGGPGSHFQGIALDVNLRLPLNQLLQYKDIVNMLK